MDDMSSSMSNLSTKVWFVALLLKKAQRKGIVSMV